jgi:IS5 family transposase
MRPKPSDPTEQPELFRSRLDNMVDLRHPLVRLAGLIDWDRFEEAFVRDCLMFGGGTNRR